MTCKNCIHYEVCFIRLFAASKQRMIDNITNPFGVTTKLLSTDCYKDTNGTVCARFINKADVQESKHGEWLATGWMKETSPRQFQFRCSNCDKEKRQPRGKVWLTKSQKKPRYCLCCGARMDGEKNVG